MTVILTAHQLSKSFGTQNLFKNISYTFTQGDRIGLVGPNGAGKSTLLKILVGLESSDSGHLSRRQGARIGYTSQMPEFPEKNLEELLIEGLQGDFHTLLTHARILLGKAQFTDFQQKAASLSGGWKKRLDIVKALLREPDLLLLDEPTNHLDLEGIFWLEKFLLREKFAYVVVSHDRYFLNRVCTKVIELNRCFPNGLFTSVGDMETFTESREAFLTGQEQQQKGLASVVRNEIAWLRKSPKARTTKSQSRVQKAHELMDELAELKNRNKTSKVDIEFEASERATRKLLVAKNLTKSLGNKQLFKGVDITLSPGTCLGIVGKNGTGKTTLLKTLARQIPQDTGTIKYADDLRLVYFDQHRETIPPHISLREALSPTSDIVNYRGQQIHVNGWAKRFLFSPDRLSLPVHCLSGGERARILIARLMLEPADILFLDEPTNDLDIPTLEVIEQSLAEFAGAVVLISHDRCLMDNVCTQILGLGEGNEQQFYADYKQWEKACVKAESSKKEPIQNSPKSEKPKKLSYHEQKELEGMESSITDLEKKIQTLQSDLEKNKTNSQKSLEIYQLLSDTQTKLDYCFERWQSLLDKCNPLID